MYDVRATARPNCNHSWRRGVCPVIQRKKHSTVQALPFSPHRARVPRTDPHERGTGIYHFGRAPPPADPLARSRALLRGQSVASIEETASRVASGCKRRISMRTRGARAGVRIRSLRMARGVANIDPAPPPGSKVGADACHRAWSTHARVAAACPTVSAAPLQPPPAALRCARATRLSRGPVCRPRAGVAPSRRRLSELVGLLMGTMREGAARRRERLRGGGGRAEAGQAVACGHVAASRAARDANVVRSWPSVHAESVNHRVASTNKYAM